MKILGIDPGVARTGWAVVESGERPSSVILVASGLLETFPTQALPERLRHLHVGLDALIAKHKPGALALEQLFFTKIARTVEATSYARAMVLLAAAQASVPVSEYNPRSVKVSLTGNGNAPKPQMQKMVQVLLGLPKPPQPDDVADAMAIALCHLKNARFQKAVVLRAA